VCWVWDSVEWVWGSECAAGGFVVGVCRHCVCWVWDSVERVWGSECAAGGFVVGVWVCVGGSLCGCEQRELNDCCFRNHSFVLWKFIGIFVIYDVNYNINNCVNLNKLRSLYHVTHSQDTNWVRSVAPYCTAAMSTCQPCHIMSNTSEVIREITQLLGLPHCQQ